MLARGLNFAPAPQRIPVPEIVEAVEGGLSRVPSSQAQLARTRIAGCLAKSTSPTTNLTPGEQKAIKDLKQADSIVIAPADKGNATVVMDQTEYDGKIRTLLADASTYRRLPRDPTQAAAVVTLCTEYTGNANNGKDLTLIRSWPLCIVLRKKLQTASETTIVSLYNLCNH